MITPYTYSFQDVKLLNTCLEHNLHSTACALEVFFSEREGGRPSNPVEVVQLWLHLAERIRRDGVEELLKPSTQP